jgi:hypothetical protein
MEMSGQLQALATLPAGERAARYSFDRLLGVPQSQSGRGGEEKNLFTAPARNRTPVV